MSELKHGNIPEFQKAIVNANKVLADLPKLMPTVKVDFSSIFNANDALLESIKSIQKTNKQIVETLVLPKIDFPRIDAMLAPYYRELSSLDAAKRPEAGQKINEVKQQNIGIREMYEEFSGPAAGPIDITAPFDINVPAGKRPGLLPGENGTRHPLTTEIATILDIFYRMGFAAVESREIDDDYYMFTSLNFPPDHPARDEYDTFLTVQKDKNGKPLVAPAHTSIMQNRILKEGKATLKAGKAIAAVIPGRVFRNEDLDARHEHTFYQLEGIYVDKGVNAGNLLATFKAFLSEYYQQEIEIASQPFYFPFTEPSFELSLSCPFCRKAGCHICSQTGWIELLGMGMIHPNVLKEAGIDPTEYTGFAWGCGIDRLVMMKYGIEDVRHFESAKLDFSKAIPMKVSLNAVKRFTDVNVPIDDLVKLIGARLGGVDEVIDLGARYKGAVIVKVASCAKHPNADKLSLCKIDDGGKTKDVERDKDGLVQVVCGAPNVHEGMLAVWLPPGATVPSTFDKDPFVLEARELRGKKSNGMLASPKELAFGDSHEGLLVLDDGKPGDSFAKTFGLDDYVIDIENKMFTHRPDCFGQLGVAREIAGIQHKAFKSPEWYLDEEQMEQSSKQGLELELHITSPKIIDRFITVVISDIKVKPSPVWLQAYLTRLGVKPINNIVDITNYLMMQTAQPLHAYDYDKLNKPILGARAAKQGEKLKILGGKTISLEEGDIVITNDDKPIGLGGIIGGADTEVDDKTKNIVLECATFDMNTIRRTAMKHGLFTDATTRFTKGQSPAQKDSIVRKAMALIAELAGSDKQSNIVHIQGNSAARTKKPLRAKTEFINERLGTKLNAPDIQKLLQNVELDVSHSGDELSITVPFWRTDIDIPEDIVEEVGRLYGYDKLPLVMPARSLSPAVRDPLLDLKAAIREQLSKAGANEVLTYSFVHGGLLRKAGQDQSKAFEIANALSPDLQYYRLSLMPSLLEKVHSNIKAGYNEFALFEIGKTHSLDLTQSDGLPGEFECTALVVTAADKLKRPGAAYYQAKTYLETLTGTELVFEPVTGKALKYPIVQPYNLDRSALVSVKGGDFLGIIGEFKPGVTKALKLPKFTAGFEIETAALQPLFKDRTGYVPLSRFPSVKQDITFKVSAGLAYASLYDFIAKELGLRAPDNTQLSLEPVDIYQKDDDTSHKQLTFRVAITSNDRTLTDKEVSGTLDAVAIAAKAKFNAERV